MERVMKVDRDFPFVNVRELRVLRIIHYSGGTAAIHALRRIRLTERVWYSLMNAGHIERIRIEENGQWRMALQLTETGRILIDADERISASRQRPCSYPLLPKVQTDAMALVVPQKKRRGRPAS